jgi:hypothetical protein
VMFNVRVLVRLVWMVPVVGNRLRLECEQPAGEQRDGDPNASARKNPSHLLSFPPMNSHPYPSAATRNWVQQRFRVWFSACDQHRRRLVRSVTPRRREQMVELRGIEPLTPSMPWKCSTN